VIGDDVAAGVGDFIDFSSAIGIVKYIARRMNGMSKIRQTWSLYNYGVPGSSSRDWLPLSEKVFRICVFTCGLEIRSRGYPYSI
jgi:hypothetical protein